jgi:DNA-binding transcriptional LysR family regulator
MTTDLVRLKSFLYAAEQMSFTEAAHHLHLTQPTVSHHIKSLEMELGVDLFERTGPGLRLTDAGLVLLPWARKVIRQFIQMRDVMASLDTEVAGQLRIACSTAAGKYVLPQLAARFKETYPRIQVTILTCTSEQIVPRLLESEADLGVVSYEIREQGFESQDFITDTVVLIVSNDHPWTKRDAIQPTDLIGEKIILREPASGTRRVLLSGLAKHGITVDDLDIFLELGNAEAIVMTVAAGYGISFVSNLATACSRFQGKVCEVPVAGLNLRRKIHMVRPALETHGHAQEAFWRFVNLPSNADLLRMPDHESGASPASPRTRVNTSRKSGRGKAR